jgi:hypothetical protein
MNDTLLVIPDPGVSSASTMFQLLAISMDIKKVAALVRYVRTDDSPPKVGILFPKIGKANEEGIARISCYWVQIPFKEDIRSYDFPILSNLLLDSTLSSSSSSSSSSSTQSSVSSQRNFTPTPLSTASTMIPSSANLASSILDRVSRPPPKRSKLQHRVLPASETDARMDAFIDSMDLMNPA